MGAHNGKPAKSAIEVVEDRVRRHPHEMLGVAALVGVISGAGLWGRIGRVALGAGARVLLASLAPQLIRRLVGPVEQ